MSGGGTCPCSKTLEDVAFGFDALLQVATHAIEYLLGAWAKAVGVTVIDLVASFVDNAGFDAASGHPVCRHQAGWTSADDEAGR